MLYLRKQEAYTLFWFSVINPHSTVQHVVRDSIPDKKEQKKNNHQKSLLKWDGMKVRNSWLFATLWTLARQGSLSMGFSRQEYWSGLLLPSPEIFPTQGLNPCLLWLLHLAGGFFTTSATWESLEQCLINIHISYYYHLTVIADAFQGFPKLGFCTHIEHFS